MWGRGERLFSQRLLEHFICGTSVSFTGNQDVAFVSFQTTRSEFDSSEYEVRRRYQDFLWLRGRLEDSYPTLIVNVCPHHP